MAAQSPHRVHAFSLTSRGRAVSRLRAAGLARSLLTARPRLVNEKACTRCGDCAAICGVGAIELSPTPVYDDDLCVRCFACGEICPTAAIGEVTPPLMRAVNMLRRKK